MLSNHHFDLTSKDLEMLCRHLEQALDLGIVEQATAVIGEFYLVFKGILSGDELDQQEWSNLLAILSRICRSYNYRRTYYRTMLLDEVLRVEHNTKLEEAKIAHDKWAKDYLELRRITKKIRV